MMVPDEHQEKIRASVLLAESFDPIDCKPLSSYETSPTACNNKNKSVELTRRRKNKSGSKSGMAMTVNGDDNF